VPPGGRIQFDEHHHGLTSERGIAAYVADRGLAPLALQLVLVAWFLLWTMRRRRAALKTARDETLTGPIDSDLIAAMAEAYRRGRAVDHAAERLMAELRADLAGLRAPDIGLKKTAEDLEVRLLKLRASRPRESALLAFAQRVVKTQESIHERR
jgi:hypothetical protein